MGIFDKIVLSFNRLANRLRPAHVQPENLLLLVPHCLQRSACSCNIVHDLTKCDRCGQCNITDLLKLRDEFGIRCCLASGGRQAIAIVRQPDIKAVVAVACEKELSEGIRAAAPKQVIAVPNERPEGPCRNTRVDIRKVRAAILELLDRQD